MLIVEIPFKYIEEAHLGRAPFFNYVSHTKHTKHNHGYHQGDLTKDCHQPWGENARGDPTGIGGEFQILKTLILISKFQFCKAFIFSYLYFCSSWETRVNRTMERVLSSLKFSYYLKLIFLIAGSFKSQLIDYFRGHVTSCPKQGSFMLIRTK